MFLHHYTKVSINEASLGQDEIFLERPGTGTRFQLRKTSRPAQESDG